MPVRLLSPLLALAMAAFGLGLPAVALPAVDVPVVPSALTVAAAPLQSGALSPGEDLIIASSVTNSTRAAVSGAIITVSLQRTPVASVSALSSWMHPAAEDHRPADTVLLQQPLPDLLRGETRTDSLIVPAATVGLDGQPWGVHALAVTVTAAGLDASQARTSIVWHPGDVPATSVAVVMPITVPAEAVGLLDSAQLAAYTAPGGVLDRQLSGLMGSQVAIGIDPRITASIRILGTEAPPSAVAWLERLKSVSNETFELSYADSDIAALAQAGGGIAPQDPISFSIDPNRFAPAPSGSPQNSASPTPSPSSSATPVPTLPAPKDLLDWDYTVPAIAWPGDNTVTDKNLDKFAEGGLTTTILSSDNVALPNPAGVPRVSATVGGHPVAVASSALSVLLREAVTAADDLSWRDAVCELSSMLALAGADRGDAPGTVLVALGRDVPPTTFRLAQTMSALQGLPWAPQTTLSQALATPGPVTATLVPKPEEAKRLGLVKAMLDSEAAVSQFSSVLSDPTLVTGPRRLALLAVLSHAWDPAPGAWQSAAGTYVADSQAVTNSISIAEGSPINLVAENGNLPITVSNSLDHPVTVYVSVRPQRAILSVMKNNIPLTIEANSQSRAYIPVQSVANGQVSLGVSLASVTGVQVSPPTLVEVNVQADWEKLATGIIAGLLVAIFGFGIWRNIAKRRRARRERVSAPAEAVVHE